MGVRSTLDVRIPSVLDTNGMRVRIPRAEQVERNRELVLDAARRVFIDKGYAGATLDAIAEDAGFSKGVVYSQFENKADLFLALLARRIDERAEENLAVTRRSPSDPIRALLRNFDRDTRSDGGWARVLIEFRSAALRDPALDRRYAELHARTVDRFAVLFEQLQNEGTVSADIAPRVIAQFVLAFGAGLTLERCTDARALPIGDTTTLLARALKGADA
jgi:AcrR family transcriptional regulator